MIHVAIQADLNKFRSEGHASYGEPGHDIVCSAVSAITQTIGMGIYLYAEADCVQEDGLFEVSIITPNDQTRAIMNTMVNGLLELQMQYPDHVQITMKGKIENE